MPVNPFLLALLSSGCVVLACYAIQLVKAPPPARLELDVMVATKRRPPITALMETVGSRFGPIIIRRIPSARREPLQTRLMLAGQPGQAGLSAYGRRKAGYFALFGGAGVVLLLLGSVFIGFLLLAVGWYWADVVLLSRSRMRQEEIQRQMADFLDILAVTVGAGLGFRTALSRVSEAVGGPLAEELEITLRQLDLGESRRKAFLELRKRSRSESLRIFVAAFLQSEELGAPLAQTLVNISVDIRRESAQQARRKAARTVPRVSLIVSFFMVPAAVLLIAVGLYLSAGDGLGDLLGG